MAEKVTATFERNNHGAFRRPDGQAVVALVKVNAEGNLEFWVEGHTEAQAAMEHVAMRLAAAGATIRRYGDGLGIILGSATHPYA